MDPLHLLGLFLMSLVAGTFGSMLGMGGGIIVVPALTLAFGYDYRTAVAASAISIIATSSGAAISYLRQRVTNTRIAMLLEVGTTAGALTGAMIAAYLPTKVLFWTFAVLMVYMAYTMFQSRNKELPPPVEPDKLSRSLRLEGSYYDQSLERQVEYRVARTLPAFGIMFISGGLSALLGIGGGAFKVLAMDQIMKLPYKVSTATANFMIGVTAATSALVYFLRGDVNTVVATPVALGVLAGAQVGARLMMKMKVKTMRLLFIPVLLYTAYQMIVKGVTG
jgi:uncharacterized membrane protein YfcA